MSVCLWGFFSWTSQSVRNGSEVFKILGPFHELYIFPRTADAHDFDRHGWHCGNVCASKVRKGKESRVRICGETAESTLVDEILVWFWIWLWRWFWVFLYTSVEESRSQCPARIWTASRSQSWSPSSLSTGTCPLSTRWGLQGFCLRFVFCADSHLDDSKQCNWRGYNVHICNFDDYTWQLTYKKAFCHEGMPLLGDVQAASWFQWLCNVPCM